jgi:hypothetical protein
MAPSGDFTVGKLQPSDVTLMDAMMTVFGEAFNDVDTYTGLVPDAAPAVSPSGSTSMPRGLIFVH